MSQESFEVQLCKEGRWISQSVLDREEDALKAAKRYLLDKKCEGARVVRNWTRSDGLVVEKEIFQETRQVKDDGPVRIQQVDEAPPKCQSQNDYAAPQARNLMNRIFRDYLEKTVVTPTELIHNYKELKRLQDKDSLLPSAVDRVSFLQTRDGSQESKSRRDEIFKTVEQMSARARKAESLDLPKLNGQFHDVLNSVRAVGGDADADFLAMVVLSRDLGNMRNWVGKLDRLCRLALEEGDSKALAMLDGVIADVLGASVVMDILGYQASLAHAIATMLDLAEGRFTIAKSEAAESAELLCQLFKDGKLPLAKDVLVDRAMRQLKSPNPLNRNEPSRERENFMFVLQRLLTPTGLQYGPVAADALTARFTRFVEEGGQAGRKAAILGTFSAMPDRACGMMYLCELAHTDFAKENPGDLLENFQRILDCRFISELVARDLGPRDRMARATNAHKAMAASPFPPEMKKRLCAHIDDILERYLLQEQIIEKLDNPDSPLRDRAVRLVQFCAAGVLPEGKALTRARGRILDLLRQPNFDAHFIDGIADPIKAQKALRDFHQLLVRAGFGG